MKDYRIYIDVDFKQIKEFIKNHHYSGSCPGGKHNFCIKDSNNIIIGCAIFGQVIGRFQSRKYYPKNPDALIELRRLVLIDDTPKNTESWFIGYCIRWLKKYTSYEAILSLADQNHNHKGTIYKATNFKLVGTDMDTRDRIFIDGIEKHPRYLYDICGTSSVPKLKEIYKDRIKFKEKRRKLVYLYVMRK